MGMAFRIMFTVILPEMYGRLSSKTGYQTMSGVLAVSPLGGSSANVQVVLAADFNGGGKQDLLLQYGGYQRGTTYIPEEFGVALGKGDGTFVVPSVVSSYTYSMQSYIVADVNGDKKPDIIATANYVYPCPPSPQPCSNSGMSYVATFLGNGDGTFQAAIGEQIASVRMGPPSPSAT